MAAADAATRVAAYLERQSNDFRELYAAISRIIMEQFPHAEPTFDHDMPGFRVRLTETPITRWNGTIDPNYLHMFLVARKRGVSFHIWNPNDYDSLQRKREELTRAGFKVMRGCIEWNRKAPFPVAEVEALLESQKRSIATPE